MACAVEDDCLETWLNKATNPLSKAEDWEAIVGFCDQVNKDLEGPQTAVRLLIHKIQSPQEKESLLALTTLEACVKNCGRRFQQEIGKFRFINEIIKVVSPKYLGNHMTDKVKQKCIELLYSWSEVLTHEPKIKEAYQMLRKQGIVKQDPIISDQTLEAAPPPPPRNSIFDDEEKSKLLSRLLKSKNPEDLQAANRLIKNMVKQDSERTEKTSRRINQLETVSNNVKLLKEMLNNYNPTSSTESDREIVKELYDNLEKQRPNLFRLASDTDENDSSAISEILKANDEVVQVMALYGTVIDSGVANLLEPTEKKEEKSSFLKDLEFLSNSVPPPSAEATQLKFETQTSSLLDEQLLSLGLDGPSALNGLSTEAHAKHADALDDIFGPVMSAEVSSSTSASSALFSMSQPVQSSGFDFGSSSLGFASTSLSSSHGTVKSTFPAVGAGLGTVPGLGAPIVPVSTGPKADLLGNSVGGLQDTVKTSQTLLSEDLSQLFRSNCTSSDASILLASENAAKGAPAATKATTSAGLEYLNELSQNLLKESLSSSGLKPYQVAAPPPKVSLTQLAKSTAPTSNASPFSFSSAASSNSGVTNTTLPPSISPVSTPPLSAVNTPQKQTGKETEESKDNTEVKSLADIFVPLEKIQPGTKAPITVYDKNNMKIIFYLSRDRPRPDVQVVAITTMSTSTSPIKNYNFQAAVPKVMKIQLQPASGTDLAAFNPILPPSVITQVMLIAHPPNEKIRLKFKIAYSVNDTSTTDVGEVEDIPVE